MTHDFSLLGKKENFYEEHIAFRLNINAYPSPLLFFKVILFVELS